MFRVSYPDQVFETQGTRRVARAVKELVNNPGATLAICGEHGVGKTVATWSALRPYVKSGDVHLVDVLQPDHEHLTINMVVSSMVRVLKGEDKDGIRRDVEARLEQLRGLLGRTSEISRVCLVIEDAHVVPLVLYRQLKRLMETRYAARKGLFSLLLLGYPELRMRLAAVPDQHQCTCYMELKKFSSSEADAFARYAADLGKPEVEEAACDRVAKQSQNARRISTTIALLQHEAKELGEKKVTLEMANAWFAGEVKVLADLSPDSRAEISKKMGWSPSKTSRVISGDYPNAGSEQQKLITGLAAIRSGASREPVPAGVQ